MNQKGVKLIVVFGVKTDEDAFGLRMFDEGQGGGGQRAPELTESVFYVCAARRFTAGIKIRGMSSK